MSAPMAQIHICENVYLDNNYVNTIHFDSSAAQLAYFAGKVVKTFSAYSYLRKSWPLKVQATMGQANGWTYLYFKNSDNSKIYYYFITQIEYVNDTTVELTLELDVMQTYYFDMNLKRCFIERQHTPDDYIGAHNVEEGLECGELDCYYATGLSYNELCIIIQSTFDPGQTTGKDNIVDSRSQMYDGVWSGMGLYAVSTDDVSHLSTAFSNFSTWACIDGIQSMWMYPKAFVTTKDNWASGTLFHPVSSFTEQNMELPNAFTLDDIFQGYKPRNKKLYSYPYTLLQVSNSAGNSATFRFERFNSSDAIGKPEFRYYGALAPDASLKCVPRNYNGLVNNYEEGITAAGYPTCAWDADGYKIWLAQNQNGQNVAMAGAGLGIIGGVGGAVASAFTGGDISAGINSAINSGMQIANILAQRKDMQVQPPQARGAYSASVNVSAGYPNFCFYYKGLTREYAEIVDSYFDMYGYKISKYGIPNRKARQNYTYIKTIGCVVGGNLCHEDKQRIAAIFDHGVTFWTDGNSIGSYGENPTL